MARATRIVVTVALVALTLAPGHPAAAGPSGSCTFDEKTGIVRVGGAAQLAVGATKEGVRARPTGRHARPGGLDRDGDGKLDLTYFTKPNRLDLLLGDVPGGVTFDASTFDLPILRVFGGDGWDLLTGSDQADEPNGGDGNDIVVGRGGDPDLVLGGPDNDTCRLGPNDPQTIGCEQII